jgi:hypothetical protein
MPKKCRLLLEFLALVAVLLTGAASAANGDEAEDPAVAAAQKRQAAVRTLDVEYEVKEVYAKGALSDAVSRMFLESVGGRPVPSTELKHESSNRLVLDGNKLRSEYHHPMLGPDDRDHMYFPLVIVNGPGGKAFIPGTDANPPAGLIFIGAAEQMCWPPQPNVIQPLTAAFRGLERMELSGWPIQKVGSREGTQTIEGTTWQEYVVHVPTNRKQSFWLDPAQDYLTRRVQTFQNDRLIDQMDIRNDRLQQDQPDDPAFCPVEWDCTEFGGSEKPVHTIKVTVTKKEFNKPQQPEFFEISFPPATEVYDRRDTKCYRVQADGSLRELDVNTGSELPLFWGSGGNAWYLNQWLFGTASVVVVAGFLVIYLQRKKRPK